MSTERDTLYRAFAESHFLVLPTQADCTPLVIAEANAFGVPCLVSVLGGLPTLVQDGQNGRLYPPGVGPTATVRTSLLIWKATTATGVGPQLLRAVPDPTELGQRRRQDQRHPGRASMRSLVKS